MRHGDPVFAGLLGTLPGIPGRLTVAGGEEVTAGAARQFHLPSSHPAL